MRAAGSGSIQWPEPDLVAGINGKLLAIECKATKGSKKYFDPQEIKQLQEFADLMGAVALVGVKFNRHGWVFRKAEDLEFKGKMPSMDKTGMTFEDLRLL